MFLKLLVANFDTDLLHRLGSLPIAVRQEQGLSYWLLSTVSPMPFLCGRTSLLFFLIQLKTELPDRMLSFFIAFCITWYSSGDEVVTVLISVACGLVALLIFWGAAVKYENEPYWGILPRWARKGWYSLRERMKSTATPNEPQRMSTISTETDATCVDDERIEKV